MGEGEEYAGRYEWGGGGRVWEVVRGEGALVVGGFWAPRGWEGGCGSAGGGEVESAFSWGELVGGGNWVKRDGWGVGVVQCSAGERARKEVA